jgi:ABC-type amino acid transport substrate-binding protein
MTAKPHHRWLWAWLNIGAAAALLAALSFLPPDTSLAEREKVGVLKLCVPTSYPPLVTGNPDQPGFDVELGQAIADRLGLRLSINVVPSIGQDFNPRNWFLTRAQCDMVAGGVADTAQTRSFLQTIPTGVETGWIGISATGTMPPASNVVAVLPGTSGLNRVALSGWLRQQQLRGQLVQSQDDLLRQLQSGMAAAAITEKLVADRLDLVGAGLVTFQLDDPRFARNAMAIGLWKGDQTLRRAVEQAVREIGADGTLENLRNNYGIGTNSAP